jgi:hypothetical protein
MAIGDRAGQIRRYMRMSPSDTIPLAEWMRAFRAELGRAQEEGLGQPVQFTLGPLELEFEMATTREAGGEGAVRFWVVQFGATAKHGGQTTQRVKLTLTPKTADGQPVDVHDQLRLAPD